MTEHDLAWGTLSDLHKDVYGFRPRDVYNFKEMSVSDIEDEIKRLIPELEQVNKEIEEREQSCIQDFEQIISDTIASGANTRVNAIKWLKDAEEDDGMTDGFFCYTYGLPYNYFDKVA